MSEALPRNDYRIARSDVRFPSKSRHVQRNWGCPLSAKNGHYSNLAGTENGLVASTTNIMRAVNSVVPLLKTSMVIPAECPFIECPASTFITPCGVRWPNRRAPHAAQPVAEGVAETAVA